MTTGQLVDQEARTRAATRFDSNLVVVAGAGTGKTSLLVERFLNLILSGEVSLSGIAAITFTEKAAAELSRRIEDALDGICFATHPDTVSPPPLEHEAQRTLVWLETHCELDRETVHRRAQESLDGLDDVFVGTIHAFCSDLLRRHPVAAEIPPEFSVDDGISQAFCFESMWTEFLADQWRGAPKDREKLWESVLAVFSEKEIEQAAWSLVRSAEACDLLNREGYRVLDIGEALKDPIADLTRDLQEFHSRVSTRSRIPKVIETVLHLLNVFQESGSLGLQQTDGSTLPYPEIWEPGASPGSAGTKLPEEERTQIQNRVKDGIHMLQNLRRVHEPSLQSLMEILRPFARQFRKRIETDGLLSFDDLLLKTRNLLTEHPEIRERESRRFRQILVDEFQDTDPLQYEIVFLLAAEQSGKIQNPFLAPLQDGKLFIVGDPKQSIYRFRGADISAYLRARRHVMGGKEEASLLTNFRSRPSIIQAVNSLFSPWMGPTGTRDTDVEPVYEAIEAFQSPASEPCVEIVSVETPKGAKVDRRRHTEAGEIARIITELTQGSHDLQDIAILFRSLMDIPTYTRALREAGIDFVVDGGRAFFERPEVGEAFSLLRALANPADRVATLGVLRSTLGGIPDTELAAFVRGGGTLSWKTSPESAASPFPRIQRAFAWLRQWDGKRPELPLDRWILMVLTESEFTLLMSAYFDGPQRVANIRKLAEKAATLTRERGVTLEQAVMSLEDEFTGERVEGESPLADESVNAVRILTMHKAKGLEFPVVLIPDLGRKTPNEMRQTRVRSLRTEDGVFLAVDVANRSWLRNAAAVLFSLEEKRHEKAETKRVFYVATTRARERLIFVNSDSKLGGAWLGAMKEGWGYSFSADPSSEEELPLKSGILHTQVTPQPRLDGGSRESTVDVIAGIRAFEAAGKVAAKAFSADRFRFPSGDEHAHPGEPAADTGTARPSVDRSVARGVGVAVHSLLETWDFRDPARLRENVKTVAKTTARRLQMDAAAVHEEVDAVVEGLLASALPGRLARAVILGREVPILFQDKQETTVFGYADLLYRLDGHFHVADYKTDLVTTPEQAELYRNQLMDYGEAVQQAWNLDTLPVLEILFVRTGDRVSLSPVSHP